MSKSIKLLSLTYLNPHKDYPIWILPIPDSNECLVGGLKYDGCAYVINTHTKELIHRFDNIYPLVKAAISPDKTTLITLGDTASEFIIWDYRTKNKLNTINIERAGCSINDIRFTFDGKYIIALTSGHGFSSFTMDPLTQMWKTSTGVQVQQNPTFEYYKGLDLFNNHKHSVIIDSKQRFSIINPTTNERNIVSLKILDHHTSETKEIVISEEFAFKDVKYCYENNLVYLITQQKFDSCYLKIINPFTGEIKASFNLFLISIKHIRDILAMYSETESAEICERMYGIEDYKKYNESISVRDFEISEHGTKLLVLINSNRNNSIVVYDLSEYFTYGLIEIPKIKLVSSESATNIVMQSAAAASSSSFFL